MDQCPMGMHIGHAQWTCTMDMHIGHAHWICTMYMQFTVVRSLHRFNRLVTGPAICDYEIGLPTSMKHMRCGVVLELNCKYLTYSVYTLMAENFWICVLLFAGKFIFSFFFGGGGKKTKKSTKNTKDCYIQHT